MQLLFHIEQTEHGSSTLVPMLYLAWETPAVVSPQQTCLPFQGQENCQCVLQVTASSGFTVRSGWFWVADGMGLCYSGAEGPLCSAYFWWRGAAEINGDVV